MDLKQRLGLIAFALIAFVAIGTSYQPGQIITPTQFDEEDFQTANLNVRTKSLEKIGTEVILTYEYNYFEKLETGDWNVVVMESVATYKLSNCITENRTREECIKDVETTLPNKIKNRTATKKDLLTEQQIKSYINELTAKDFHIPDNELN